MGDTEKKFWFVGYTRAFQEKKLVERLAAIGVESYIATQKVRRRWSDRIKIIEEVVLKGHIFIYTTEHQRVELLKEVYGLCGYMTHGGTYHAVKVPEDQLKRFQAVLAQNDEKVEFHMGRIAPGDKVIITAGPFAGIEGEIVRIAGEKKFAVRVEGLGAALVNFNNADLEKKKEQ